MESEPPIIFAGKRFDGSRCYADAIKNAMSNSTFSGYAGTLYVPRDDEELILGLPGGEHGDYNSIVSLYLLPFVKNALRLQRFAAVYLIKKK
jgi:hypothetical protein